MKQRMFGIIAIVNKVGNPNIFMTMTSSLQWEKVGESVFSEQKAQGRPSVCARSFQTNYKVLLSMTYNKGLIKNTLELVEVIEF